MRSGVRISAAVMAHPSRLAGALRLRSRHPTLNLHIVLDPAPDQPWSALRTARCAWRTVAEDSTHHLVLQDDAILCEDFSERLRAVLVTWPDQALSLFTEWGSETSHPLRIAALSGAAWVEVVDWYVPSVALVMPAHLARAFAAETTNPGPEDDVALRLFLAARAVRTLVPVPNMVDHDPGPSLTGNDHMGPRRSACFLGFVPELSAQVLEPSIVPCSVWWARRPFCLVADPADRAVRRRVVPSEATRRLGLPVDSVGRLRRAAARIWTTLLPELPADLVRSLWTTSFLLGAVAARESGSSGQGVRPDGHAALESALARPAAERALATLPQGALRSYVDPVRLSELEASLASLVWGAVRQGFVAAWGTS